MATEKRMIDAKALERQIKEAFKDNPYAMGQMLRWIRKQPTVYAVEVVPGRWKYYHKQNIAVCTNCSFERDLDANFGRAISCPNCGAKMDGDGNDSSKDSKSWAEVVRCKDCKHYMAEEKERCEALRSTPYGLCLKHRCLPLAGYHEYRNEDDFCSYGERIDNETG